MFPKRQKFCNIYKDTNNMKKSNIIFTALISFLTPFAGFFLLYKGFFGDIVYHSHLAHSILLIITCAIAFYAAYLADQAYLKTRDPRVFVTSLAFYIFGLSFLSHAISIPDWQFFNEAIFDITEHYGLFIGALILFALAFLPFGLQEKIYRFRMSIFVALTLMLFIGFATLFIFPAFPDFLTAYINLAIVLTGFLFFCALLFLFKIYHKTKNILLVYMVFGFGILINSGIIPLFYREWNVLWWYFHVVFLSGFLVILFGVFRSSMLRKNAEDSLRKNLKGGFENIFGEVPLYAKISTRIILFVLSISLIPLLSINYFIFKNSKNNLEKQVFKDLVFISDSIEGQVWAYLDSVKSRTVDFSSDGFIRDKLKEIAETSSPESIAELNNHLVKNKKPIDDTLLNILITDTNGIVVGATDLEELGKDESDDEYVVGGRKGVYVTELSLDERHFGLEERALTVSAPLTDKITGEQIGVITNYFGLSKIQNILSGEFQFRDAATAIITSAPSHSAKVYIVDKNKILFVEPSKSKESESGADKLGTVVDVLPVRRCLDENKEMMGTYINYKGEEVFGISTCIKDRGWVILLEMNRAEIFKPITDLENSMAAIIPATVLIIIFAGVYFSGRFTKPIELLTETTRKIAGGDLGTRASIKSKNEIGILADNFNRMTDNLMEAKRFPENIIRSMKDSLMVITPALTIKEANEATLDLLGYARDELINKPIAKVVGAEITQNIFQGSGLEKIINDGFVKDLEISYLTKGDEGIPVSISGSAMKNEKGELIGIVVVAKDIRIFKEVEKAKSEFVSIAAHQLRTPLSIIKWTIQMMLDEDFGKLNTDQRKVLEDGDLINGRMIRLVSDLLNVSRIEEGKFVLKFTKLDISRIIEDVILALRAKADRTGVELIFVRKNGLPKLNADNEKIYLALENLIENALKYTQLGGKVLVEAEQQDEYLEIRVMDNGMGIPKDQQDKIFSRFFRSKNAQLKETEGSGLGLYIAKDIIEKHNGKIWFESPIPDSVLGIARTGNKSKKKKGAEDGPGTVFYVRLPY